MICRIYDVAGATNEQYEQVAGQISMDKPKGAHVHIAGRNDRGLQVIEVWDSQEDIDRYMDAGPGKAMQGANLPADDQRVRRPHARLDLLGAQ